MPRQRASETDTRSSRYERELIAAALPFWEAEAEIVRRFFKRKPSRDAQIFWLRAQAMDVIYRDEKSHYREAAREAAGMIRAEDDLARMKKAIREISLQRVHMRNEMFGYPLPRGRAGAVSLETPVS